MATIETASGPLIEHEHGWRAQELAGIDRPRLRRGVRLLHEQLSAVAPLSRYRSWGSLCTTLSLPADGHTPQSAITGIPRPGARREVDANQVERYCGDQFAESSMICELPSRRPAMPVWA